MIVVSPRLLLRQPLQLPADIKNNKKPLISRHGKRAVTLGGKSAQGITLQEQTVIPNPAAGMWTVETRGWLSAVEQYRGTVEVEYILR